MTGMTHPHVYPPLIKLIQETHNGKLDKYFLKLKLCIDPMLTMSNLYELQTYLFDNGEPDELLLFICNFNMNLAASGTLEVGVIYQYLLTLVRGDVLRQFDPKRSTKVYRCNKPLLFCLDKVVTYISAFN